MERRPRRGGEQCNASTVIGSPRCPHQKWSGSPGPPPPPHILSDSSKTPPQTPLHSLNKHTPFRTTAHNHRAVLDAPTPASSPRLSARLLRGRRPAARPRGADRPRDRPRGRSPVLCGCSVRGSRARSYLLSSQERRGAEAHRCSSGRSCAPTTAVRDAGGNRSPTF